jgi:hypothetical protein
MPVTVVTESKRGCGYRKPSKGGVGIYLVGPGFSESCGRLPLYLHVCPTCSGGIKFSRAWTWINPRALFASGPDCRFPASRWVVCTGCPMGDAAPEKAGLLWVGEKHYPTPESFLAEAARMGVSKKLPAIPKGFEMGTTRVYLAHKKAVELDDGMAPGIFSVFMPSGVDLVIDDEHSVPERAEKLAEKLGDDARIIKVIPDEEQLHLGGLT